MDSRSVPDEELRIINSPRNPLNGKVGLLDPSPDPEPRVEKFEVLVGLPLPDPATVDYWIPFT